MSQLPTRKPNRLASDQYRRARPYFLTVCTLQHRCILSRVVPAPAGELARVALTREGQIVRNSIEQIPAHYTYARVEKYVVMPNHIHLLLWLSSEPCPVSVSHIIQQMKGTVSKQIGAPIWQKGFYDHIIRTETDYREIWQYIDNNPQKWALDKFYQEV